MVSASATAKHPKGPPQAEPADRAGSFLWGFLDSSVGAKLIVALTGLGLVGFVVFHMIGNLKVFQGPEAVNGYAYFLKHDLGTLIWVGRAGLLGIFVLHIWLAVRLQLRSRAARPVRYQYPGNVQATISSRTMLGTGIVVGLFTVFHLAHFTFGWVGTVEVAPGQYVRYLELKDAKDPLKQDVYSMVVAGFRTPWLAVLS
jgi:succinate dehydrogenase / fumarate reductase, cytochrome b subunit